MISEEQKQKAEKLYEQHARMATYYASKFYKYISYGVLTKEDLDQTAALSLWKACLSFDETKGFKFYTYCSRILLNELVLFKNKSFKYDNEAYISYDAKVKSENSSSSFLDILGEEYSSDLHYDNIDTNIFLEDIASHINSYLLFEGDEEKLSIIEKLLECYNIKELTTIFDFQRKDIIFCQKLLKYVITNYQNLKDVFTVKYKIYDSYKDRIQRTRHLLKKLNYYDEENKAYSILLNNNYSNLVNKLKQND